MPDPSAAADRLDYWIRRHAVQLYCGIHPAQKKSKSNPAPQRLVGLSAIGQCLKDQYDALASPRLSMMGADHELKLVAQRLTRLTFRLRHQPSKVRKGWAQPQSSAA